MSNVPSGFVVRWRHRWFMCDDLGSEARPVSRDEVRAVLRPRPGEGSGADSLGSVAPLPPGWVGRIVDGGVVVEADGGERFVTEADLEAPAEPGDRVPLATAAPFAAEPRAPLRDPERSQRLLADGWTTFPFLDSDDVALLRDAYRARRGWSGDGLEVDLGNSDRDYRQWTAALIGGVVNQRLSERFADFTPFLYGFSTKWPQAPEIHLHWDWSCVDEAVGHRCYQVWVALDDTTPANGQMSVVPRSHLVDRRPRGTNISLPLSPEFAAAEEGLRQRLVPVPMRAGDALMFDQGLVHISCPNTTDEPRVAAVSGWRPAEAALSYYRRLDDDLALRYFVDAQWFTEMVPDDLINEPPRRLPAQVVDLDPGALDGPVADFVASSPHPRLASAEVG